MAQSNSDGIFSSSKNFISSSSDTDVRGTTIPASEVEPPLPFDVQLGITVVFTAIYALLFIFIISQLVLILHYRHRRLSYQSLFLFTCLLWASVRTTLFSFYFEDCKTVNSLSAFPKWFLFALPIYLQFLMLTLLTLYLVKVSFVFISISGMSMLQNNKVISLIEADFRNKANNGNLLIEFLQFVCEYCFR